MLILSIAINIGMYTERFLIIATTQSQGSICQIRGAFIFRASVEISIIVGSLAMFVSLFLVFVKIFPSVSIYEVKETMDEPGADAADERSAPNGELSRAFPRTQSGARSGRQTEGCRFCRPRKYCRRSRSTASRKCSAKKKSIIKRFTFFGALIGGISGFTARGGVPPCCTCTPPAVVPSSRYRRS